MFKSNIPSTYDPSTAVDISTDAPGPMETFWDMTPEDIGTAAYRLVKAIKTAAASNK